MVRPPHSVDVVGTGCGSNSRRVSRSFSSRSASISFWSRSIWSAAEASVCSWHLCLSAYIGHPLHSPSAQHRIALTSSSGFKFISATPFFSFSLHSVTAFPRPQCRRRGSVQLLSLLFSLCNSSANALKIGYACCGTTAFPRHLSLSTRLGIP